MCAQVALQNDKFALSVQYVQNSTGKNVHKVMNKQFVQHFQQRFTIFQRCRTCKKELSQEQIQKGNKKMAFHLERIKNSYDEVLYLSKAKNYDESQFIFDMDGGKVLDFQGTKRVRYAEVSSTRDKFTVSLRISGASNYNIVQSFIVFTNSRCSYPIQGLPDNVLNISYKRHLKNLMDRELVFEYFKEERVTCALLNG